jgi:hypothetical protein
MIAALALTAALLVAPAAPVDGKAPPATPQQIASARAKADAIIQRAEAVGIFENITADATPTVRHRLSGMTCAFSGDDHDYIRIFPMSTSAIPRGEDVGCGMRMAGSEHSIYATRYPDGHSARDDLNAAIAALRQRLPDAQPHSGPIPVASRQGGPEVLMAAYDIKIEDTPKLTLILVAKSEDWNFKHRATGPADEGGMALMAGIVFVMSLPGGRD